MTEKSQSEALRSKALTAAAIPCQRSLQDMDLPPRLESTSFRGRISWFAALCLSGIGMFIEAYIIITTGQIKSIWKNEYPTCWASSDEQHCPNLIECCGLFPMTATATSLTVNGTCIPQFPEVCNADGSYPDSLLCDERIKHSVSYAEFAGIMAGMAVFGILSDSLGRVRTGVITSVTMIAAVTLMAFYDTHNLTHQFTAFAAFYCIFGIGVGGEYPITATNAALHHLQLTYDEDLDPEAERQKRFIQERAATVRRGETISLCFAMQGVGAVTGSLFLVILIYFGGQSKNDCSIHSGSNSMGTDPEVLNLIWRAFYFIGGLMLALLMLYRWLVAEEGEVHQKMLDYVAERDARIGKIPKSKILSRYLFRLIGTGGNWFLMDVAFYGLKLFSAPIFASINPKGDLLSNNMYLLVNNLFGLLGYYCCATLIDRQGIGRKKLQYISALANFIIFSVCAGRFNQLDTGVKMFLFFLTNFVVNFGANTTTYVMAAEAYPMELRGTCHGLSAFMGKFGALIATIAFGYMDTVQIFWVCASVNIAGFFVTLLFSADMTGVSLDEHTAQLELWLEGRPEAYKGVLHKPEHLSNFEIWTGMHGEYEANWMSKPVDVDKVVCQGTAVETEHSENRSS